MFLRIKILMMMLMINQSIAVALEISVFPHTYPYCESSIKFISCEVNKTNVAYLNASRINACTTEYFRFIVDIAQYKTSVK